VAEEWAALAMAVGDVAEWAVPAAVTGQDNQPESGYIVRLVKHSTMFHCLQHIFICLLLVFYLAGL
jgi:hypothetical protein